MRPLIEAMRADGHEVEVTARDFAQTLELCERFGIAHTAIGVTAASGSPRRRWGSSAGAARCPLGARARLRRRHRPRSNDVSVAAALLRIPAATAFDYEFAAQQHHVNCRLCRVVMVPEAIPPERLARYGAKPGKLRRYSRAQGGVLPRRLRAVGGGLGELGLDRERALVVVRTPPEVSLYHRFENRCSGRCSSGSPVRRLRPWCFRAPPSSATRCGGSGAFVVPEHAVDAQSLVAYRRSRDLAGGTMNREAVALGTPVYTPSRGRLGAVDERAARRRAPAPPHGCVSGEHRAP
jgi:predicted glycosyltransferase